MSARPPFTIDSAVERAAAEAGYAPLRGYIARQDDSHITIARMSDGSYLATCSGCDWRVKRKEPSARYILHSAAARHLAYGHGQDHLIGTHPHPRILFL